MAASSNRESIDRFFRALNERKVDEIVALLDAEIVQDWPQSGERFRGCDNIRAVLTNYPSLPSGQIKRVVGSEDKWVLTPTWTPLRITGTGDEYTIEGYITYASGERWSWVSIVQFRDGKVYRLTEYFAAPFPPAEWRSKWVETMESSSRKG